MSRCHSEIGFQSQRRAEYGDGANHIALLQKRDALLVRLIGIEGSGARGRALRHGGAIQHDESKNESSRLFQATGS